MKGEEAARGLRAHAGAGVTRRAVLGGLATGFVALLTGCANLLPRAPTGPVTPPIAPLPGPGYYDPAVISKVEDNLTLEPLDPRELVLVTERWGVDGRYDCYYEDAAGRRVYLDRDCTRACPYVEFDKLVVGA